MKGRKPKPTKQKEIAGNPGRRPLNVEEPQHECAAPDCPEHLSAEAAEEWHRITDEMVKARTIATIDRAALAAYCQAWARWVEAETQISQTGGAVVKSPNGHPMQNPWLSIANKAIEQLHKLSAEFGFTPSSRSRVNAFPATADPFSVFMGEAG